MPDTPATPVTATTVGAHLAARWPDVFFIVRPRPTCVVLEWADGPTADAVRAALDDGNFEAFPTPQRFASMDRAPSHQLLAAALIRARTDGRLPDGARHIATDVLLQLAEHLDAADITPAEASAARLAVALAGPLDWNTPNHAVRVLAAILADQQHVIDAALAPTGQATR